MDAGGIIPRSSRKVLKDWNERDHQFFLGGCGVEEGDVYLLWYVHECRAGFKAGRNLVLRFWGGGLWNSLTTVVSKAKKHSKDGEES